MSRQAGAGHSAIDSFGGRPQDRGNMTVEVRRQVELVGRQEELRALARSLDEARTANHCVTMLVSGEPGIGKSRLIREFGEQARRDGALVVTGEADEMGGAPAFQPFRDALLPYIASCPPERLTALVSSPGQLAPILPELSDRLPDSLPSQPIIPLHEPFRLFETVAAFLSAVATEQPGGLVLIMEDLHWADESTLALLRHLARRLTASPVMLVISYRDTDVAPGSPFATAVEALSRSGATRRVDLRRLGRGDVRQLIASLVRPNPTIAVVDYVYAQTDGNPFLVTELTGALHHAGRLLDGAGAWNAELSIEEGDLPRGVLLVAAGRLHLTGAACREALVAASVLGRDFDFSVLEAVSGMDSDALTGAMDEATRLGLIEPSLHGLRFSHELVRQALLAGVSPPRRQQLHLKAAREIQQLTSARLRRSPDLAHHLFHAGQLASPDEAVHSAMQAGDEAIGLLAYADATRFFTMAIERLEQEARMPEGDALLARLLAKRGDAFLCLSRHRDARPDFERAAAMMPPEQRVEVLVPLALARIWTEDMTAANQAAAEADALVTELGRDDLRPAVEAVIAYCETDNGDLVAAIQRFRAATRLPGYSQVGLHSRLLFQFPLNLYWTGQFQEAVDRAHASVLMARRANDDSELATLLPSLGMALAACGRYREAAAAFEEGRLVGENLASEVPSIGAISKSTGFHVDTFDYEGARALALQVHGPARAIHHYPYPAISSGIDLLLICARQRDLETARSIEEAVVERIEREHGRHGFLWRMRLAEARSELALASGDAQAAFAYAEDALALSRRYGRQKYQALSLEARGRALLMLGRRQEALESLKEAVEIARPTRDPAMFLRAAAEVLAVEQDEALLNEAALASDQILANLPDDMKGPFEASEPVRLLRELRSREPRPADAAVALPHGLSPREFEVLQLLAGGNSNQQIAEELVLSVRTVERHINHIYAKLNVHSRTQATAFVLREGRET
jgi:DNA-binding CsgD family transcriptional regulator/predicted negative regulator of RcsB-dependent stress response